LVQNSQPSPVEHPLVAQKRQLRYAARARRDALGDRAARSAHIQRFVSELAAYRQATALHCYLAMRSEVETRPLLAAALAEGKAVATPLVDAQGRLRHSWLESLHPEAFTHDALGIAQPLQLRHAQPGDWQLTLVPLLAFDRAGYRLGYGKGYYDRLLTETSGLAVGLAFACQEVSAVPREAHDRPLDLVVTEAGIISTLARSL
jgi:5-formyltetrahydrofolate cyclo-ligase